MPRPAPRPGLHSAKPKIMYEIIERMYPGLRKIELFARGPARPGWTNWGLEAEGNEPNKSQRWMMGMPSDGSVHQAGPIRNSIVPLTRDSFSYYSALRA
jgi:hypothetical protein